MTGADAVRYSFIVMDLHHLLLAGLPGALRVTPINGHHRTGPACRFGADSARTHGAAWLGCIADRKV